MDLDDEQLGDSHRQVHKTCFVYSLAAVKKKHNGLNIRKRCRQYLQLLTNNERRKNHVAHRREGEKLELKSFMKSHAEHINFFFNSC